MQDNKVSSGNSKRVKALGASFAASVTIGVCFVLAAAPSRVVAQAVLRLFVGGKAASNDIRIVG